MTTQEDRVIVRRRRGLKLATAERLRIREWLAGADARLHREQVPYDALARLVEAELGIVVGSRAVRRILGDLHRQGRVVQYQGARSELYCLRPPWSGPRSHDQ